MTLNHSWFFNHIKVDFAQKQGGIALHDPWDAVGINASGCYVDRVGLSSYYIGSH